MAYTHLSKVQRSELSILRNKGHSYRDIAGALGIHYSTVCRELRRHVMRNTGEYDPVKADHKAYVNRLNSKYQGMKISSDRFLEEYVKYGLIGGWTPEEISGRLKRDYARILGFKSIYAWLYSSHGQAYTDFLPSKRVKPKRRRKKKTRRQHIPDRIPIHLRPKIIDGRRRVGDFEGDTMGKPKRMPQTLVAAVDRKSRYLVAKKVKTLGKTIEGFKAILPAGIKSLTLDNGVENVRYQKLKVKTYFCHSYCSWEKGSIENTFQRLRRYIPKKANLADFSPQYIATIVEKMNNTPRKCLKYRTPAEVFKEQLQH